MTDYDQCARDIAEAQKRVLNAMTDVEDVERDSNGWDASEVESAANAAVSALEELSDALDRVFDLAARLADAPARANTEETPDA